MAGTYYVSTFYVRWYFKIKIIKLESSFCNNVLLNILSNDMMFEKGIYKMRKSIAEGF